MVLSKESQQPLGIASVPITQPPETESQRRPYLRTQPRLSKQALSAGVEAALIVVRDPLESGGRGAPRSKKHRGLTTLPLIGGVAFHRAPTHVAKPVAPASRSATARASCRARRGLRAARRELPRRRSPRLFLAAKRLARQF